MSTSPTNAPTKLSDHEEFPRKNFKGAFDQVLKSDTNLLPIIAFCHLQWDWVWQRPQQFLSRLAKNRDVLFVETHRTDTRHAFVKVRFCTSTCPVTILEIHLPESRWADGNFIDLERRRVMQEALNFQEMDRFVGGVLWFNDPMAVTAYAGHLNEALIVYDCMDELTQFNGAPPQLRERELYLTVQADVIFCGGRKMRNKRLPLNANTHFYGTGVDCSHFGTALLEETLVDKDIQCLPGPVLGYFGVIDERLDYDLIVALADAFPHGSIAMIGPLAKVERSALPNRPNLHWFGARPYAQLPSITKGFKVCLMPFALNASTEFINPTKALEYLAAGCPVVSTALDEVRTNCAGVVRIANDHAEFIKMAIEEAVHPSSARLEAGLALAADNSWEAITAALTHHIERTLALKNSQSMQEDESMNTIQELAMSGPNHV